MIKTASFAYAPPKGKFCSDAFMQNLNDFPPAGEIILYSDDDWGKDVIRLRNSPEIFKDARFADGPQRGKPNPFAMHNAVFLAGLKMCKERGVTHALYLEQDCRVGRKGWDEAIFEEYFNIGRPVIVAGTISVYNPSNSGTDGLNRFYRHFGKAPAHGVPTAIYGYLSANTQGPTCLFPNGALCVYDVAWVTSMFNVEDQGGMATQNTAFDMAIGGSIWNAFSEDAYEVIGSLGTVLSAYGNVLTSDDMRKELLTSGKICAVHQIKNEWIPEKKP